jgi:hypothetical protein
LPKDFQVTKTRGFAISDGSLNPTEQASPTIANSPQNYHRCLEYFKCFDR